MNQYEQVVELINELSNSELKQLVNTYASYCDYDYYIYEDLDEVLELHYECRDLTVIDIKELLIQFSDVSPYSSDYIWVDGYGNFEQGTLREALDDKLDVDLLADFCIDCPDEVADILTVPEEEEEEDEEE